MDELPLTFRYVTGHFDCRSNNLTSLKGCPLEVGKSFYCDNNRLTSLEFCPTKVGRGFFCSDNKLTRLEGCPKHIPEHFNCSNNNISTLLGSPSYIGSTFYCYDNSLPESLIKCGIKPEIIIKYQDEYQIWYSSGELNKNRLDIMINDFKMGYIE